MGDSWMELLLEGFDNKVYIWASDEEREINKDELKKLLKMTYNLGQLNQKD